ncbi:hypothetical protein ACHQM5_029166 [Ranunculus cassubicifolius]
MASNDQSYKIGEAKGQTQEKAGHMMDGVKDTAQAAKAKVTGEKTAGDHVNETAQATRDTAQAGSEKTGNAFTATGDKIKEVAGGATDAVKNTLGMNGK